MLTVVAAFCRPAFRFRGVPDRINDYPGFRVAPRSPAFPRGSPQVAGGEQQVKRARGRWHGGPQGGCPRVFFMPETASVATLLSKTELQREFPLHVVCTWLGNSPRIAQQSYLLVTEDSFARATGVRKVMVEG